ncbi:hypothetical protein GE09DRAFT_1132749 [Coniochaeta sp. 2T2.1]|nr:hypothetical protein GE09DRAFT_1132749 [Coniochaeta sp. 2T2.1]
MELRVVPLLGPPTIWIWPRRHADRVIHSYCSWRGPNVASSVHLGVYCPFLPIKLTQLIPIQLSRDSLDCSRFRIVSSLPRHTHQTRGTWSRTNCYCQHIHQVISNRTISRLIWQDPTIKGKPRVSLFRCHSNTSSTPRLFPALPQGSQLTGIELLNTTRTNRNDHQSCTPLFNLQPSTTAIDFHINPRSTTKMYLPITLLLTTLFPSLIQTQTPFPATTLTCDDSTPAKTDYIAECGNTLAQDPTAVVDASSGRVVVCYRITRGRTDISEVVVLIREGHEQGRKYTTTKGDVDCAVRKVVEYCQFGKLVGGRDLVCGSEDLVVSVEGRGNDGGQ